jgi:predicted transcriptional regulator
LEAKQAVRELLARLPDDCSFEDILYHLYVIRAVERGLEDADVGREISHEEVGHRLREEWVSGTDETGGPA